MSAPFRLPGPGDVVFIKGDHIYRGADDLTLSLTEIGNGTPIHPNVEWVHVAGQALQDDATPRGYRSALVRLAALRLPAEDGALTMLTSNHADRPRTSRIHTSTVVIGATIAVGSVVLIALAILVVALLTTAFPEARSP